MKNNLFKKIIGNKITGIILTVLLFVIVIGAIFSVSNLSIAADSLPGIVNTRNDILDPNNPYKILEIVPDVRSAEIGFLINGEEPLINSAFDSIPQDVLYNQATGKWMSVNEYFSANVDIMDTATRVAFMNQLVADNADYINMGSASADKPLWYETYTEEYNGAPVDASTPGAQVINGGNTLEYGWLSVGDGTQQLGWNAVFKMITFSATYEEVLDKSTPYYMVDTSSAESVRVLREEDFMNENATDNTYPDHYYVYEKIVAADGRDVYAPYGTIGDLREACLEDANVLTSVNSDEGTYFVVKFKVFTNNDYTNNGGPIIYEASEFEYVTNGAPYVIDVQPEGTKGHNLVKPSKNIYYLGGIHSNEWFKRYSLDVEAEETGRYYIDVVSMTPGMLNGQSDLTTFLDDFDFIYLNHGTSKTQFNYNVNGNDISVDVLKNIFENICNDKTACIVDYSLVATTGITGENTNSNIYALACMLMQEDYRSILEDNGEFDTNKLGTDAGYVRGWYSTIVNTNGNNYVNGNVMVIYTAGAELLSNYCEAPYSMGVVQDAYREILDEIELENLYRSADTESAYEPLPTSVYKATVVRYIINYKNQRQESNKKSINVLEIQPAAVQYTDNNTNSTDEISPAKVRSWLNADNSVEVNIVTMTTNEFIGTIEDLNAEYDLIYIGSDIYKLNKSNGLTNYADNNMDGLIYCNIGDFKKGSSSLAGVLDTDYLGNNRVVSATEVRFIGNDITADKYNALVDYVKGAYPIVVSDTLCDNDETPNASRVDNCSYLYSFLQNHLKEKNVFRVGQISAGDNIEFEFYINRAKLSIGTKVPGTEESSVTDGTAFVIPGTVDKTDDTLGQVSSITKENNKFNLKFKFTITNEGAVYSNTQYYAGLYLDSNADGKFSYEYEEIPDISIVHAASGDAVKNGELVAGEQYVLTRQAPEGYSGVLTWKVEVSQAIKKDTNADGIYEYERGYVRDNVTGYTKLVDPDKVAEEIKVLQIHKDSNRTGNYLDLETAIGSQQNPGNNNYYKTLVWGGTLNNKTYAGIANDYILDITSLSHKEFNAAFKSKTLNGKAFSLSDYDMLILGFYEAYNLRNETGSEDISTEAINGEGGIKSYIDSGRSVLFAHDTTSFINLDSYSAGVKGKYKDANGSTVHSGDYVWGYTLNKNIREMVGMDMYGVSIDKKDNISYAEVSSGSGMKKEGSSTDSLINKIENKLNEEGYYEVGLKSLAYKPKSGKTETVSNTHGYSYTTMERYPASGDKTTYRVGTNSNASGSVKKALKVNEGQITTYPYYLGDSIETASTHNQYYALDMNADDDRDGETDLVVWYTLSGSGQYDSSPKDVANNYYIYNKGNITYTGVGHSGTTTTLEEAKLFINTIIAAYNASEKLPEVIVFESGDKLVPTTTFYDYGDTDNEVAFYETSQRMYFQVTDTNVIRGTKKASVMYYVALKPGESAPAGETVLERSDGTYIQVDLQTYTTDGIKIDRDNLECGTVYYVDIPIEIFNQQGVKGQNVQTFLIRGQTTLYKYGSLTGEITEHPVTPTYAPVDFVHVELFPLD